VKTSVRPAQDTDWWAIERVTNEALPNAPDGNAGWLEARKRFDDSGRRRRHYVAEGGDEIVAYGGIEETDDCSRWRMFLVMAPGRLRGGFGERMLDQLLHDARQLGASTLWMREQGDDPLLAFMRGREFVETRRFVIRDGSAYDGVEVVELERSI
jgi:GNAT superfamily N-acetyltransferase